MITHAFAGIDPPRSLTPAAALVPNLTPTSPQSRTTETTSDSSHKPVFKAAEAAEARITESSRDPSPAPAHKVHTAGPRSTPSPPSSSPVKNDPHTPKTSLDPQDTHQAVKIHTRPKKLQTRISPENCFKMQASSEKAKDSSVRDPSRDGSLVSVGADPEIAHKASDVFHTSTASHQRLVINSNLSSNAVISNSLPTHEEEHEKGASRPLAGTNRGQSSKNIASDQNTLPRHGSLPQESKFSQGPTTAEPGSPRLENQLKGDLPTAYRNSLSEIKGSMDGPVSASTTTMVASKKFVQGKPDTFSSATLMGSNLIPETRLDSLASATSTAFVENSDSKPDASIHSPESAGSDPTSSISGRDAHEAPAPTIMIASPEPLPSLPVHNSDLYSVLANDCTLSSAQSKSSNSIEAVLGNQTATASQSTGTFTARTRAQASSTSKNVLGGTSAIPHKNGVETSTGFCLMISLVCLASLSFSLLV